MAIDIKKFIARFVEESRDNIQKFDDGLSQLENDPNDKELINALFRAIHTIKGSSRMLKLTNVTDAAHKLEDVLDQLRSGDKAYSSALGEILQNSCDMIAGQIDDVHETGNASKPDAAIMKALDDILENETPTDETETQEEVEVAPEEVAAPEGGEEKELKLKTSDMVRVQRSKLDELIKLMGEVVSSHGRLHQRLKVVKNIERHYGQDGVTDLQKLHDFGRDLRDDVFHQQLLMEELHSKALIMRMLPLSVVFEPAARLVREVSRSLGKKVTCKIKGGEIELDRQMIDKLSDPMVHLIRNAVDHGLEASEERKAAGKSETGEIQISAQQDGGWVLVEVRDNGAGISLEAVKKKVLDKKLKTEEELEAMTDKQIINLIFLPGFSTSAMITDISGRGVGLDVVKRNILDDMQGRIDVDSKAGEGSVFQLRLPLSLAVMRILLVDVAGQSFGFTAQNIFSLIEVQTEDILLVAERKAITFHNEFVPLLDLAQLLGIERKEKENKKVQHIVVVQVQNEKIALGVDALNDELDMVIKPLPDHLLSLSLVAGMVMTGNNELISILHTPTLVDMAARQAGDRPSQELTNEGEDATGPTAHHVLVVDDSLNTREIEKSVLEAHGYQVTLAEDGQDGLNKAMRTSFDAVLTDVEMPIMDGFTLTKALRETDQYAHLPIIIITSRAKEADKRRGMEAGADAYIVKGDFEQNNLINTLQALLG
ncbi:MAG: response regulator [Methylocystaceae bacterium]|nr:response regulator [Methylocystaceae bacterium]